MSFDREQINKLIKDYDNLKERYRILDLSYEKLLQENSTVNYELMMSRWDYANTKLDIARKLQSKFENSFDKLEQFYDEEIHENLVSSNAVLELIAQVTEDIITE